MEYMRFVQLHEATTKANKNWVVPVFVVDILMAIGLMRFEE